MEKFSEFQANKILFISYSRNSLGYIIPAISLAKSLHIRGHDVVFACSEEVKDIPISHGLRHVAIREKPPMPPWNKIDIKKSYREVTLQGLGSPDYLRDTLSDEIGLIKREEPDLVIHNFRFTAGIAAKRCGVRCVSILNMNILIHYPELLPIIMESIEKNGVSKNEIANIFGDVVLVPDYSFLSPMTQVDSLVVEILMKNSIEVKYCGPWLKESPYALPGKGALKRKFLKNPSLPLLFITLGGSVNASFTLEKIFKSIANEVNLIVITGPNVKKGRFSNSIREIQNRYPNTQVTIKQFTNDSILYMKAADLAIIHGGHSTTMEALMCGTSILGVPDNHEQRANLEKVLKFRTGRLIESTIDWATLPKLIEDGLSAEYKGRAAEVSSYLKGIYMPELIPKYLETYIEMTG